jgi:ribosomal protein S18 acetylase RimI-like enzyme
MPTLRLATFTDAVALATLEKEIFDYEVLTLPHFRYFLSKAQARCWLIGEGGKVFAYLLVLFRKNSKLLRIYSLAVASECRGQGLAQRLLATLEDWAKTQGYHALSLEVREDNFQAIRFYKKQGFIKKKLLKNYYGEGLHGARWQKVLTPINA